MLLIFWLSILKICCSWQFYDSNHGNFMVQITVFFIYKALAWIISLDTSFAEPISKALI